MRPPETIHHRAQAATPTPIPTADSLNRRTRWRSCAASRALTISSPLSRWAAVMGGIAERTKSAARSTVAAEIPLSTSRSIGNLPFRKKARQIFVAGDPVPHLEDRLRVRAFDRRQGDPHCSGDLSQGHRLEVAKRKDHTLARAELVENYVEAPKHVPGFRIGSAERRVG